jgi:hypothetical protein
MVGGELTLELGEKPNRAWSSLAGRRALEVDQK